MGDPKIHPESVEYQTAAIGKWKRDKLQRGPIDGGTSRGKRTLEREGEMINRCGLNF